MQADLFHWNFRFSLSLLCHLFEIDVHDVVYHISHSWPVMPYGITLPDLVRFYVNNTESTQATQYRSTVRRIHLHQGIRRTRSHTISAHDLIIACESRNHRSLKIIFTKNKDDLLVADIFIMYFLSKVLGSKNLVTSTANEVQRNCDVSYYARLYTWLIFGHAFLKNWWLNKMANILQTTFSNAFSWTKTFEYQMKFYWSMCRRV